MLKLRLQLRWSRLHFRSNWDIHEGLCLHIEGLEPIIGNWHAKTYSTLIIDLLSHLPSWNSELTNKSTFFSKNLFSVLRQKWLFSKLAWLLQIEILLIFIGVPVNFSANITIKITVIELSAVWKLVYIWSVCTVTQ